MLKKQLLIVVLLLTPIYIWAQQKPAPKIIRVGKPMADSVRPSKKADTIKPTIEKIGNTTIIRLPDKPKPPLPPAAPVATGTVKTAPKPIAANPFVQVSIRLMESRVGRLQDLVVYITLTNKARFTQDILFDKPYRPGFGPWHTECIVRRDGNVVTKYASRNIIDSNKYSQEYLVTKKTSVLANNWIMKGYALNTLVVFPDEVEKTQKLPSGTYELQISYMGMLSNVVNFYMR